MSAGVAGVSIGGSCGRLTAPCPPGGRQAPSLLRFCSDGCPPGGGCVLRCAIRFQSVSAATMNHKMGGRSRVVPILTGLVALVFLAFGWGAVAIQYVPIALLSGLVLYVGLDFVQTWLLDSRKRMTDIEYCLLVAIAFTIVVWDV